MAKIERSRVAELTQAALLLYEARRNVEVIPSLPPRVSPRTIDEAYEINRQVASMLGWEVGGWFCGATNPDIQARLQLSEPYCARLFAPLIYRSPASIPVDSLTPAAIEIEIAVRMGEDLPPRQEPYSRQEVEAAVASVHPSIDVVAGHLDNWMDQPPFTIIADNGTDGALVLGDPHHGWRGINLADLGVEVRVNSEVVSTGHSSNVTGGPFGVMTWLANTTDVHGGLKRGHIYNTGTLTPPLSINPADEIKVEFEELGTVSLRLANGAL